MATTCAARINELEKIDKRSSTSEVNEFLSEDSAKERLQLLNEKDSAEERARLLNEKSSPLKTDEKSSPLKTGGGSQTLVQAANLIQAAKQLDPATASLEARLKRLEDALQRPLALGEFEEFEDN